MTWFLPKTPDTETAARAAPPPLADQPPPGFFERLTTASHLRRVADDQYGHAAGIASDLQDQLLDLLPPDRRAEVRVAAGRYRSVVSKPRLFAALSQATAADPARYGSLDGENTPLDQAAFDALVLKRRRAEYDDAANLLAAAPQGSWAAEFLGDAWASTTDEVALATLPFGAPGRAALWLKVLGEVGLGAGSEALVAPRRAQVAEDLGLPTPNAAQDIALAGLGAGVLGGAILGAARFAQYRATRPAPAAAAALPGTGAAAHEGAVDAAAAALATGKPLPAAPGAALPPVAPDAPPDWAAIRGGIFAGESRGDYDALYGFSNRPGGPFADVKLTAMTVDQAIAFAAPGGRYATWVRQSIGRVATPMGAYQIVGQTLRKAKDGLGLRGDELMTPELQERLGQWIYRQQGTAAWTGYRGPDAGFTPGQAADFGARPDYSRTRRGYTVADTLAVGDTTRVGIRYEVVDAAALQRASGRFQPRDRSQANSAAWIAETAAGLDPARLMPAPDAATGTPLVGPDGMIESGNGRVMAIERAYELHPDRADAYRAQIEAAGFDIPPGTERPVLIARRTTPLTDDARAALTVAAQDSGVAQMTPAEIAGTMARDLTPERLARLDPAQPMAAEANRPFVLSLLQTLPKGVRNGMFAGRELTADAERALKRAVFSRAWDDPALIRAYVSTEDAGDFRQLLTALDRAAPAWAAMRGEIAAGRLRPEFDITGHVSEAMQLIARARADARAGQGAVGAVLDDLLDDVTMLDGALSPLTIALVRRFWRNGRAVGADTIADLLTRYADEAARVGRAEADMFGQIGPAAALRRLDPAFADLPDDFGIPRHGGIEVPPAEPLPAEAFDAGAQGPEVAAQLTAAEPAPAEPPPAAPADAAAIVAAMADNGPRQRIDLLSLPLEVGEQLPHQLKAAQPYSTLDPLMAAAARNHEALNDAAQTAAAELGLSFKRAPLKKPDRVLQKVDNKYAGDFRRIADVARTGVTADTIDKADAFVAQIARRFHVVDEGWNVTPAGYFDRKLMIRFDDGQLGEVQIWPPGMLDAKGKGGGHKLYELSRDPSQPAEVRTAAEDDMRVLYGAVRDGLDPSFAEKLGGGAPARARNAEASADDSAIALSSPSNSSAVAREGGDQAPPINTDPSPSSDTAPSSDASNLKIFKTNTSVSNVSPATAEFNDAYGVFAALRAEFGEEPIDLGDGRTVSLGQLIDDIDQDDILETVIDTCLARGAA